MPGRYLFGSGFDSLAQQRQSYDQLAYSLADQDRQARERAAAVVRAQADREQQRQDQMVADSTARQYQFGRDAQVQAERASQDATQQYQFGVGQQFRQKEFDAAQKNQADTMAFNRDLIKTQASEGKADADYSDAEQKAQAGILTDPKLLDSQYPNLTPVQKMRVHDVIANRLQSSIQQFKAASAAATAATGFVNQGNVAVPEKGSLFWKTPAVPAKKITESEAFEKLAGNRAFSKVASSLEWDEDSQGFTPIIPDPTAKGKPETPATPAYNFGTPAASPAPQPAPLPSTAGQAPIAAPATNQMVSVVSPTGVRGRVPAAKVQAALRAGYQLAQ